MLYAMALVYLAMVLPIGPNEAKLYYGEDRVLFELTHFAKDWFTSGLAFRLPFLFFGLVNILLFFIISRSYFKNEEESYLSTTIFALLPGVITSSVLVNIGGLVVTFVLLFLIFHAQKRLYLEVLVMILLLFIHDASIIFFIAIAIYSGVKKDRLLLSFSLVLAAVAIFTSNGLEIGGRPSGEFMELFGLYMALFSPFVFLYFFYALYRIWLREEKDILWYISFTAFTLSILLSLRQQVIMTDFAPYVVVAVVLMILIYHKTVKVRLPQFQKTYRLGFNFVVSSLILSALVILFHQSLFLLLEDKSKNFTYPFYRAYWQVQELKEIGQNCYTASNPKLQYQLKYYGIEECQDLDVPKIHK